MSRKTTIATAATVVGISALTSTAVFAHGGGGPSGDGHLGGGGYSAPHLPMNSMPRPSAVQSIGKLSAPPTTSTPTAPTPRFVDKARQAAAQQAAATPGNPSMLDKAKEAARLSAQQAAATPGNPSILDKAKEAARLSAQQAAATPSNPPACSTRPR